MANRDPAQNFQTPPSPRRRFLLRLAGQGFFVLGVVGAVLPIMPTTIFWIVAGLCFIHADPKAAQRLFAMPGFGRPVEEFCLYRRISRRGKMAAILGMSLAVVIVALTVSLPWAGGVGAILVPVAVYVATRPEPVPRPDGAYSS